MNIGRYRNEAPPLSETLANGTVLLTVPVAGAHSISLGVWLRHGTQDEPAGLGGLAHFLEHIVFKGSRRRSAFAIANAFDSLGAAVDAFTTKDHVAFTLKVLPEYFAAAAEALADMLIDPALDPDMIALEQDVVVEEIQEARDTPEDLLHDAFAAQLYGEHPRSRPILGSIETVRSFDAATLRRGHGRLFCGPGLVIAAAGNVDAAARETLRTLFAAPAVPADGEELGPPAARSFAAAEQLREAAEISVNGNRLEIVGPVQQCYFEIGNPAVSYRHADRIPLFLLANLLGGGMSSRIFQAVREREGLAYSVYIYTDMGRDVGLVSCAGSCSPAKASRLESVVREEYARLLRDGVADDELESNRAQLKSQLLFSLEGVSNQMARAAKNEIYYGRFLPVLELVGQIDAVDVETLMGCAARYFDPDRLVVATHRPSGSGT